MKNLKSLKEALISKKQGYRELTVGEQKYITAGYYTSLEECVEDCRGGDISGWDFWSHASGCILGRDGYYTCKDS